MRKGAGSPGDIRLRKGCLFFFEQVSDTQLEAWEYVVSADDVFGTQGDCWGICLTHRELASKLIHDPDLFDAGIKVDPRLAVDIWSGVAWGYHLDREIRNRSNICRWALGQSPLSNEGEIGPEHGVGILLKYETGIVREELAKLVRQNEYSKIRAQFSGHFAMNSAGWIHLDQCSFDENIGRVRPELVQIFGGEESSGDHGTVLCLMASGSGDDVCQS